MTSSPPPSPGQPDPAALLALGLATQAADSNASSTPPLTPAELAVEFPQLEILELLGRGGMGAVYKARQRDLDRLVALKILRPGLDADPGFAERFTREARALAQLNHPGIVTLYEFGKTSAGRYFILMEFVDGVNLRQLLAAGRLSPREALAIVPPLCDALQYAHDRGIVHRDIKPENLLIDRLGRIKIADFGIAKITTETTASASASSAIRHSSLDIRHSAEGGGTPAYMAPEQRDRPAEVDHRADLYALGVVLYQMLTGELPSAGQLRPPSTRVQLDVRLDEIVLRALEKDPARRYAAATDFKTQVETVASTPITAPPVTDEDNDPSHTGRSWRDLAWASVPLVAVLLVFFNPWGNRAWIYFGAGCAVLALLPDFGLFRRSKPRAPITPAGSGPSRHPAPSLPLWPASVLMLLMTIFCGFVMFCATGLPSPVTTHFNFSGQPDGWAERGVALLVLLIAGVGLPLFLVALFGMLRWMPAYLIELPHRDFWLAPQRVALTHARFLRNGLWLAVLVQTFFCTVPPLWLIIHKLEPVHLPPAVAGLMIAVFFTALVLWGLRFWLQFRKPVDPPASRPSADSRLSLLLRPAAPWLLILLAFSAIILPVDTAVKILQAHQAGSAPVTNNAAPRSTSPSDTQTASAPPRLAALDWLDHAEGCVGEAWSFTGENASSNEWRPAHVGITSSSPTSPLDGNAPRYLCLWFTHPRLDAASFVSLTLLDPKTNRTLSPPGSHSASGFHPAANGNPPWVTVTIGAGTFDRIPSAARIVLAYAVGESSFWTELPLDATARRALATGVSVSPPGQGADGLAFIEITRDRTLDTYVEQFDFIALTRDGRRIESRNRSSHTTGNALTQRYIFDAPLEQLRAVEVRKRGVSGISWDVPLRPERILSDERALRFDRAGDTMQNIVMRLRREHGVRLAFENLDFTVSDAVTLGARLAELEAKEARNRLQSAEVRLLRDTRRLRDENKLAPGTLVDVGARYTGIIDGDTVAVFLDRLTDDTPYLARKLGATWLIQPRAASRLNFPVTLKTAGLTMDAAVQAILAQSPSGNPLGAGMVFAMPVAPGTDPTPWLSVLAPGLDFKNKPAAEALCLLTESARPASLWELAGYRDSRMLSLSPVPADDTLTVVNAAQAWLRLIDQGSFIQSWRDSAALFQKSITESDWVHALNTTRSPLGGIKTRRLKTTQSLTRLPDAPEGRYLVIQFTAEFSARAGSIETVTFSREPDGVWRALGYFIK